MKDRIILLGASGSIGQQTLDIIDQHPDLFSLSGLSVGTRTEMLDEIIAKFHPGYITIKDPKVCAEYQSKYPDIEFFDGDLGLEELIIRADGNFVVNALMGYIGLKPTVIAINQKKKLALANKETLVAGGSIITKLAKKNNVQIRPIDSEHSAIWQCLRGNDKKEVEKIIITASGGSLRDLNRDQLANVTVEQALKHPSWNMGSKITIDSATMMNKGFEVIEASWLFDIDYDHIETILHKESIIHSMIEYKDHSIIAQLGNADMRIPIQYALMYPNRLDDNVKSLDLTEIKNLSFEKLSFERYPLLKLAYEVGKKGGNMGAILNGANESAVKLFLNKEIGFTDIEDLIFKTINYVYDHNLYLPNPTLDEIIESDHWAYEYVKEGYKC